MDFDNILKAGRATVKKLERENEKDNVLMNFQVPREFREKVMRKTRRHHIDLSEYLRRCCQTLLDYDVARHTNAMQVENKDHVLDAIPIKHRTDLDED